MSSGGDPNFPADLDIHPLVNLSSDTDARFDSTAQEGAIRTYGIAGRIWEASHAMLAYLDPSSEPTLEFDPPPFTRTSSRTRAPCTAEHPITALELGSGTGFVAARVAGWMRPDLDLLVVTDLPEVCPLLETNLRTCPAVRVRPLAWGSREHSSAILQDLSLLAPSGRRLTHILCSDLIYFPALLAPLLRSLLHLTSPPSGADGAWSSPSVIISYKIRSLAKETPFWNAFGLWFDFAPVLVHRRKTGSDALADAIDREESWERFFPGDLADEMFVLVATRRSESRTWRIPEEDTTLLSGVGAHGTDVAKSDDQFEQLLLMGLDV
ncbi:putative methyltransferase-domain-containing protein [Cerioporus squamosus]|nr:putative methyltransferase-domain-containing protein [Cerioporus squamosus]